MFFYCYKNRLFRLIVVRVSL